MEIHKIEDKRWVIYTNSQSPMQLNTTKKITGIKSMYDILAELKNQDKQIIQCRVSADIENNKNEEANKAIDM